MANVMIEAIDYGPLAVLVGAWTGDRGLDVAPEPDGIEESAYHETIVFDPVGDVTNAERQTLVAVRYVQIVRRKSNDEVFHHQTGYWMWDAASSTVMQSLVIPRGVAVLAGGTFDASAGKPGEIVLEVRADGETWGIAQSPFMRDNARTVSFRHRVRATADRLSYAETTILDIYGKPAFEHTDTNVLARSAE